MRPQPLLLAEFVDLGRVSRARLDEALARACPRIIDWCDQSATGLTRKQLREHVVANLPLAFRVGLQEMARGTHGRFGWHSEPPRLTFAWAAYLDLLEGGECVHTITLECITRLNRSTGAIRREPGSGMLRVETDVPWTSQTQITLRECELVDQETF
jgi:hypothetical protein